MGSAKEDNSVTSHFGDFVRRHRTFTAFMASAVLAGGSGTVYDCVLDRPFAAHDKIKEWTEPRPVTDFASGFTRFGQTLLMFTAGPFTYASGSLSEIFIPGTEKIRQMNKDSAPANR